MLTYLAIRDFAIVDRLQVEFGRGFTALTGETGAGKSILVNAIALLLGGRASPEMIRTDKDSAEVEAVFLLPSGSGVLRRLEEAGLSDGETLSIRRTISQGGKNRIFINDRSANLSTLAAVTRGLLDISGQHEHVALTVEDTQREILDDFGGLRGLRSQVQAAVNRLRELRQEHTRLIGQEKQRAEREEFLRFALSRIGEVDPRPGEDEELDKERNRVRHVEKLAEGLRLAHGLLYQREGSAVELLGKARAALESLLRFDPDLQAPAQQLDALLRGVEDLSRDLDKALSTLNPDPQRLEEIEGRLQALKGLMRAHGPTLPEVIEKRTKMQQELQALGSLAARIAEMELARDQAAGEALRLAGELSGKRREAAMVLAGRLGKELVALAMPGAQVEIRVNPQPPENLGETGIDEVSILLSANPGEAVRPLSKVASGGELSRVLLALKVVLAAVDPVASYVFDEVDSGVSGAVAEVIGMKLAEVSERHQVLCITHLPQIAARASDHFAVSKQVHGGRTTSEVAKLSAADRVEEIARMAGGRLVTAKARSHARELLQRGRKAD